MRIRAIQPSTRNSATTASAVKAIELLRTMCAQLSSYTTPRALRPVSLESSEKELLNAVAEREELCSIQL
jgi:hypothetical protein